MTTIALNLPTLAFVVGTRAALGVGVGLFVSEKLSASPRRRLGAALIALGAATTIPAIFSISRSLQRAREGARLDPVGVDSRLIGAARFARKGDDDDMVR